MPGDAADFDEHLTGLREIYTRARGEQTHQSAGDLARWFIDLHQIASPLLSRGSPLEPGLALLLVLYSARHQGDELTALRLGRLAALPLTTVLRRLGDLEDRGFVARVDANDGRRQPRHLTAHAIGLVEKFLSDAATRSR